MTAPAQYAEETTPEANSPAGEPVTTARVRSWQPWALALICVLAAALYAWGMWSASDWGNTFYTAAVKSMSDSFTNFLFGSFDPAGVVTVDKPPMALWPMVGSVLIFGFHPWAIALPQVLEGVGAVFLLHRAVRLWFGENVALLAALILALTPITVAIDHVDNPDAMLVFWSVAAAYALSRAIKADVIPRARTTWLLWCAFFLGCAFITKMLAGWIVVPGFAVAYLFAVKGASWKRQAGDLAAATGVLLVSSFWWPLLHDWWPGAKPYMDNSTDGTALNLIFAYNGINRITGNDTPGGTARGGGGRGGFNIDDLPKNVQDEIQRAFGGGGAARGAGGIFGGGTGIGRMFGSQVGGQISWLIPFSLLVLAAVLAAGVIRWRRKYPARPALRAGWVLWGSWLVVTGLVFSYAQGIWHPYYTTMLAPPIAAIAAAGLVQFWRYYRNPNGFYWLLLPAGVLLTTVWAYVLVDRDTAWNGWAGPAVAVVGGLAVVVLVAARLVNRAVLRPARIGLVLAGVALLMVPAVWASATAFGGTRSGGAMAAAGPSGGGGGFFTTGGGGRTGTGRGRAGAGSGAGGSGGGNGGGRAGAGGGAAGAAAGFGGGFDQGTLTSAQQRLLAYVVTNAPKAEIKLAIEGTSQQASPYIIGSDYTVIGMGGFSGSDNAPTVDQLKNWVATGKLKFVLGSAAGAGRGGGFGGGGSWATTRNDWVAKYCTVVPASAYGGTTGQTLYKCGS